MAIATIPQTCSPSVQTHAERLETTGYGDQIVPIGTYLDSNSHGHYRYSVPSESAPQVAYVLDYNIATRETRCSCMGGMKGNVCKHAQLFSLKMEAARQSPLERRITELERQVRDLTQWLEAVGQDMLERTT